MGKHKETKLEPADVKKVQDQLNKEKDKVPHAKLKDLSDVNSILFGLSDRGQSLWSDLNRATTHVNAALDNLHTGLGHYHDALGHAAKHIQENEDDAAADARLLTVGLGLISKPFYQQRHHHTRGDDTQGGDKTGTTGGPNATNASAPLLPWGPNRPEAI